jgi:NSS family neurotransmitter:Na+ symporter
VFVSLPVAFAQMPWGQLWAAMFFGLLAIGALSGGTSLFGARIESLTSAAFGTGRNWFDFIDYVASNWLLPVSGLGIALFFAWSVGGEEREQAFKSGTRFARLNWTWVWLLRFVAPPAVIAVFMHAVGVI